MLWVELNSHANVTANVTVKKVQASQTESDVEEG